MGSSEDSSKKFPQSFSTKKGVLDVYGSMGDDFMFSLQGLYGLKQYRKMQKNDPIIGGLLLRMSSIYSSLRWSYEGEEIIDISLIRKIIMEMTSVFTYGFYVGEILYSISEGDVKVVDIEPRGQLSIYDINKDNVIQNSISGLIPIDKCLYLTILSDVRWKFGVSLLRHIYKPYYYKKSIEAAEAVGADRDLAGLPILSAPEGFNFTATESSNPNYSPLAESTLNWAMEVVSNIRRDEQEGVVLPFGWKLELLKGQSNGVDTDKILRRYNTEICIGLLEGFVAEGAFSSSTRGASDVSISMFLDSCEGWATFFEDNINNQVIKRVCEYNGIKDVPKLKHSPVNAETLKDLASFVGRLISQGAITPTPVLEESLLKLAKLPEKGGK